VNDSTVERFPRTTLSLIDIEWVIVNYFTIDGIAVDLFSGTAWVVLVWAPYQLCRVCGGPEAGTSSFCWFFYVVNRSTVICCCLLLQLVIFIVSICSFVC